MNRFLLQRIAVHHWKDEAWHSTFEEMKQALKVLKPDVLGLLEVTSNDDNYEELKVLSEELELPYKEMVHAGKLRSFGSILD